jgi:hypothetical protein
MTVKAPFSSDFMLLDVKGGRRALARKIEAGGKVEIWIKATIEGASGVGRDDGTSREFSATVHEVKVRDGGLL